MTIIPCKKQIFFSGHFYPADDVYLQKHLIPTLNHDNYSLQKVEDDYPADNMYLQNHTLALRTQIITAEWLNGICAASNKIWILQWEDLPKQTVEAR